MSSGMNIAVVMLGNERHKCNDFGYWSIYAVLKSNGYTVDMLRLDIRQGEEKAFVQTSCKYDLIFLSIYYDNLLQAREVIRGIRKTRSSSVVVTGGCLYTYQGYVCLQELESLLIGEARVDFVMTQEPELACAHITQYLLGQRLRHDIADVAYLEGKNVRRTPHQRVDVESYDYISLFQAEYYKDRPDKTIYVLGSRGCTSHCAFCFNHSLFDDPIRIRTAQNVVEEIKECQSLYGHSSYYFIDSSFDVTGSDKRIRDFTDRLSEERLDIDFTALFKCTAHTLDRNDLRNLRQMGLCSVYLGCEAFNDEDIAYLGKDHTKEDIAKALAMFSDLGIGVVAGIISHHPYSKIKGLEANDAAYRALNLAGSFPYTRKLRVFPGSRMYDRMRRDNIRWTSYDRYDFANHETAEIDEVLTAFQSADIQQKIEGINFYYRGFTESAAYKTRRFAKHGNKGVLDRLDAIQKHRDDICRKYGDEYSGWFLSLLEDTEHGSRKEPDDYIRHVSPIFDRQLQELRPIGEALETLIPPPITNDGGRGT